MATLQTLVDTNSDEFRLNMAAYAEQVALLRERLAGVRNGGSRAARERHESRGKLFVHERIERLLDPGTAFLESSTARSGGPSEMFILRPPYGVIHIPCALAVPTTNGRREYPLPQPRHACSTSSRC